MEQQRQHTYTNLADVWRDMVRQALATGEPQKTAIPGDVSMKLAIDGGRVRLLVMRRGRMTGKKHLSLITGCCRIPRHAARMPAQGQHEHRVGGKVYFAVEFSWDL